MADRYDTLNTGMSAVSGLRTTTFVAEASITWHLLAIKASMAGFTAPQASNGARVDPPNRWVTLMP